MSTEENYFSAYASPPLFPRSGRRDINRLELRLVSSFLQKIVTHRSMYWPQEDQSVKAAFEKDLANVHLLYDYAAKNPETGADEKWEYEIWFYNENRIVYAIHGGPMAGRINFQTADYQCIRPGELWQCNWLEETGTVCSLVYDIPNKKITTLLNFSKGHWEQAEAAHGNKRNPADLERWRGLAKIGHQTDRHILNDQADIKKAFKGQGDLEEIQTDWPTL